MNYLKFKRPAHQIQSKAYEVLKRYNSVLQTKHEKLCEYSFPRTLFLALARIEREAETKNMARVYKTERQNSSFVGYSHQTV